MVKLPSDTSGLFSLPDLQLFAVLNKKRHHVVMCVIRNETYTAHIFLERYKYIEILLKNVYSA